MPEADRPFGPAPAAAQAASAPAVRPILAAVTATSVGALPVFLVAALAPLIGREIPFTAGEFGLIVSSYYGASALASVPMGRLAERLGPYRSIVAGSATTLAIVLGVALLAREWTHLLLFMILAGPANAISQLGANLSLARSVRQARQGLAFGIKQSAIPISTMLGGLAVPFIGLTVGWRWAFIAVIVPAMLLPWLARVPFRPAPPRAPGQRADARMPALVVLAAAAALAAGATNGMGTFYVKATVDLGLEVGLAGLMLALGSASGIVARIVNGWLADRRGRRHLVTVVVMIWIGALGMAALALGDNLVVLAVATVVAFGMGWGWNGLFHFAVVRASPGAPAAATGVTMVGIFGGGFVGPLMFAALVEAFSYQAAWVIGAVTMVAAGALVLVARAMLRRDAAAEDAAASAMLDSAPGARAAGG